MILIIIEQVSFLNFIGFVVLFCRCKVIVVKSFRPTRDGTNAYTKSTARACGECTGSDVDCEICETDNCNVYKCNQFEWKDNAWAKMMSGMTELMENCLEKTNIGCNT